MNKIGVNISRAVKRVVITHWHDDHARGIASVLEAAESADLVCSGALRTDEFKTLLAMGLVDPMRETCVVEFAKALEILQFRANKTRVQAVGPTWAHANRVIYRSDQSSVHSLAPSDSTLTLAFHEMGAGSITTGPGRKRMVAQSANEVSVVLWVELGKIRCLLGGDLECQEDTRTGWTAILNSSCRQPGKALVFKVPHHGSETAYEPRVWSELLEQQPYAIMSPWSLGNKAIPTTSDCLRILKHTDHVYQTTPTPNRKPTGLPPSVKKLLRRVAPDLRDIEGPMGHVRIRADQNTGQVATRLFGKAYQVSAPSIE